MTPARQTGRVWSRVVVAGGLLVLCIFCSRYFRNPTFISYETDWLQYPTRYAFAREAWLAGEPPLWCHYLGGGYFIAGDPDGQALTLITPFVLLFGEVVGLKAALAVAHVVAFAGMLYLMRRVWRLPVAPSVYAGLLLSLSTWLPARVFQGNWSEMYYVAAPWIAAFVLRARRPVYGVALGVVLGLILPQARQGWAALVLFAAVVAAIDSIRRKRLDALWIVGAGCVVALLVGAVKLLPALWLLREGAPLQAARDLYTENSITALHWTRFCSGLTTHEIDLVRRQSSEICIGYGGATLMLLGMVVAWRRAWPLALTWFLFGWLIMAWRAPVDLFHWLHSLPVFDTMMNPIRDLDYFLVVTSAALAGFAAAVGWRKKWLRPVVAIVCAASVCEVFAISSAYHKHLFTEPPADRTPAPAFEQRYCLIQPRWAARLPDAKDGNAYFNIVRGIGTVNYHTSLALPEYVEPARFVDRWGRSHPSSRYRGEAYALATGAHAALAFPKPNHMRLRVTLPKEDVVVINQNYDASWRASEGEVVLHEGKLALRLPAGEHEVRLGYVSWLFRVGLGVSLASLAVCAILLRRWRRLRWLRRWPRLPGLRYRYVVAAGVLVLVALWAALRPRVLADALVAKAVIRMAEPGVAARSRAYREPDFYWAADLLAKAQRLRPRSAAIARRLGVCRLQVGESADGLRELRRAVALAPRGLTANIELLRALAALGQTRSARDLGEELLRRFPLAWQVHFWSAFALCQARELDAAERMLARAIELGMPDTLTPLLRHAPEFGPLRRRSGFPQLLDAVRARQDGG